MAVQCEWALVDPYFKTDCEVGGKLGIRMNVGFDSRFLSRANWGMRIVCR